MNCGNLDCLFRTDSIRGKKQGAFKGSPAFLRVLAGRDWRRLGSFLRIRTEWREKIGSSLFTNGITCDMMLQ